MIAPKQLAEALDRLDPRDRELLSLSLRRRVPDDALAEVFGVENAEIARRRARAIERLADEMNLQRGEELGAVLKALLEPDTWSEAAAALGEEFAAGAGASSPAARLAAVPSAPALVPVPDEPPPAEPEPQPQEAGPKVVPVRTEPVLEMLAAREREAPDPPRRTVLWALVGLGIAALVGAAGVIGATQFGENRTIVERTGGGDDGDVDTPYFEPNQSSPLAAPFPTDPETMTCYSTAYVSRPTVLYRKPGGARRVKVSPRTEWGSPRVLGVVRERGAWLGVQAPQLDNGEIGWVRREGLRLDCARWSLHADLSKRRLLVRRDGETVRKLTVAVGRSANPTPRGRFTVTDKLKVSEPSASPYGCCVLALSGHQADLPEYWPGGDRLAVHATVDESSIGQPVSLGCLRAKAGQANWLIHTIPLGAPIFIRA